MVAGRAVLPFDGAPRELVEPPVVHLHVDALAGTLDAERSAGFAQWVDGAEAFSHRNRMARLLLNRPEAARRLIRLGILGSAEGRAGPSRQATNPGSSTPGEERSPLQRRKYGKAYEEIVAIAVLCCRFGLTLPHTRAMALQALHLAEVGHHALVGTAASSIADRWRTHALAATNKVTKSTLTKYRGCVLSFCAWATEQYGDVESVLPLSRSLVVAF